MTTEDRLRRAMAERTSKVEPRPDGLARIEQRLADAASEKRPNRRLIGGLAAGIVMVALVAGAAVMLGNDDEDVTTEPAATGSSTATTEATTTTAATPFPSEVDPDMVLFPAPSTSRRFDDPVAAVQFFATELLAMPSPAVGPFQQIDARSGVVEVRVDPDGGVTTVLVRRMDDDAWYVTGASTATIRLDTPTSGATIRSPVQLTGEADPYEGGLDLQVFADGFTEPIGTGFVTVAGGSLGPFAGEITFTAPDEATHGAIVLSSHGSEPAVPWAATVIRVRFG